MVTARLEGFRRRVTSEFEAAFGESHSPREVAGSFSFGTFVTTLPTFGTGVVLFVLIAYRVKRVSKLALFVPVLILNPIAKWGVYAVSFWVGTVILGPPPSVTRAGITYSAAPEVAARLLVGNLILAVVFAVIGYVMVYRLVVEFRRRDLDLIGFVQEEIAD